MPQPVNIDVQWMFIIQLENHLNTYLEILWQLINLHVLETFLLINFTDNGKQILFTIANLCGNLHKESITCIHVFPMLKKKYVCYDEEHTVSKALLEHTSVYTYSASCNHFCP